MEILTAKGHFHAAHRQLDYEGRCAHVHGHTWRGSIVVRAERFPRVEGLDMSVDFGALKEVFRRLDHRMLVSARDRIFLDGGLFDPEGVVLLPGDNPSVENVALYCMERAVEALRQLFPDRGIDYDLKVTIQETDNNLFTLQRSVTI